LGALGRSVEDFGADWVCSSGAAWASWLRSSPDAREAVRNASVARMDRGFESIGGHIDYLTSVAGALDLS
jgi:hypothetical protein